MAQKPICKSFSREKDPWEALKKKLGITVKDTARKEPEAHKYA